MCGTKQPVKFPFKWAKKIIKPVKQKEREEDKIVKGYISLGSSTLYFSKEFQYKEGMGCISKSACIC